MDNAKLIFELGLLGIVCVYDWLARQKLKRSINHDQKKDS